MMKFQWVCKIVCCVLAMAVERSARAEMIINGNFGTGNFAGWTVSAIDDTLAPINPSPFVAVVPVGGGNAAQFLTGQFSDGLFIATLAQSYTIDAAKPFLNFDFSLPHVIADTTGTGTSSFFDSLLVSVSQGLDTYELLLMDRTGAMPDPFGTASGIITLGVPPSSSFSYHFRADLTALAGKEVTLFFDLNNVDDGFQWVASSNSAITNVSQDGRPIVTPIVPEPSTLVVWSLGLVAAIPAYGRLRRRRRK